jgi:transcriptional regulator with XRE-family HTH domain
MGNITDKDRRFFAHVGRELRTRRQDNGKSLKQLADESGVTKQMISLVELGESDINVRKLARICKALHCSLADFFEPIRSRERAA